MRHWSRKVNVIIAVLLGISILVVATATNPRDDKTPTPAISLSELDQSLRMLDAEKGVRAAPRPTAPPTATTAAKPPAPKPKPPPPPPARVAGLNTEQTTNARIIVRVGLEMGVSKRGIVIAMATALQESKLHNYRNAVDHDSLGVFQQRPSVGVWGTSKQIVNVEHAATMFYRSLLQYKGDWNVLWQAAQRVQRSSFPYAYQQHESYAYKIVNSLLPEFK